MNPRTAFIPSSPSPLTGEGRGEGETTTRGQGFALVSALMFLLVITLIGVSLFLGVNLQQKAAGNTLQKTRALQLAKTVTLSAERWLTDATMRNVQSCVLSTNTFRVCSQLPANPSNPSQWGSSRWGGGATTVSLNKVAVNKKGGNQVYYKKPGVWVSYLGRATMGPGDLYVIYAYAWGGNEKSQVVTEAVFYIGTDTQGSTPAENLETGS